MPPPGLFLDENTNELYCMGCICFGAITRDDRELSCEIIWKILSDDISNF